MTSDLVSIIIPNRDRRDLLHQALASVRGQTDPRWEAIVVDDGSSDDSVAMVERIGRDEPRVRVMRRRSDSPPGAQACRNQGAAASRGAYVIFLDSDDVLAPHCLAQRVAVMQADPSLDFAVFPCQVFRDVPGDLPMYWNAHTPEDDLDRLLKLDVPWQTASPIWTRRALEVVGPWDEDVLSWQDWEFHLRAVTSGLTYRKFDVGDCYWRMPGPTWTSSSHHSARPAHVASHGRMLARVARRLRTKDLLTEPRKRWLAAIYLLVARNWLREARIGRALTVWRECRELGVADIMTHMRGLASLMVAMTPFAGAIRRVLGESWAGIAVPPPFDPVARDVRTPSLCIGSEVASGETPTGLAAPVAQRSTSHGSMVT